MFAPNHHLHNDNPIILCSIPLGWRRKLSVAAALDGIFKSRFRGFWAAVIGNAFPLAREGAVRRSLDLLGARLDRGYSILIYPEGKLTVGGPLQEFKSGHGPRGHPRRHPRRPDAPEGPPPEPVRQGDGRQPRCVARWRSSSASRSGSRSTTTRIAPPPRSAPRSRRCRLRDVLRLGLAVIAGIAWMVTLPITADGAPAQPPDMGVRRARSDRAGRRRPVVDPHARARCSHRPCGKDVRLALHRRGGIARRRRLPLAAGGDGRACQRHRLRRRPARQPVTGGESASRPGDRPHTLRDRRRDGDLLGDDGPAEHRVVVDAGTSDPGDRPGGRHDRIRPAQRRA